MWKIWKEEIYKIASRKIVWCGLIVILAFLTFRLWAVQKDYTVTIDGQTYHGKAAVEKDKKLAEEYAGPLTEEKVRAIYDRFGFSYYDEETGDFQGNFCSRFITEKMTNYRQMVERDNPDEIQFMEGEGWDNNVAPLLKGDVQFDYTYGWEDLKETCGITMLLLVSVILIIGLSPIFAEEYTSDSGHTFDNKEREEKCCMDENSGRGFLFGCGLLYVFPLCMGDLYLYFWHAGTGCFVGDVRDTILRKLSEGDWPVLPLHIWSGTGRDHPAFSYGACSLRCVPEFLYGGSSLYDTICHTSSMD